MLKVKTIKYYLLVLDGLRKVKTIKNYLLILDGFGNLPLLSIQHPTKGVKESYIIFPNINKNVLKLKWFKKIDKISKLINNDFRCYITISGELIFEYDKETDIN